MMQTRRGFGLIKVAAGIAGLVAVAAGAHHLMGGGCPLGLFECHSKDAANKGAAVTTVSIQGDECPLTGGCCSMSATHIGQVATNEADCFATPDMIVGPDGVVVSGHEQTASNAGK